MAEMTLKEAALYYAKIGLAVFPIKSRSKQPLTGHGCKDASKDTDQIAEWWDRWPDANVGIATGSISGGLVVIDLDIDEDKGKDGYEVLRRWQQEHGTLPETALSITGRGGYHYLYRDSASWKNRTGLYEGVDVRGNGGYIVAPPSVHPRDQFPFSHFRTGEKPVFPAPGDHTGRPEDKCPGKAGMQPAGKGTFR